MTQPLDEDTEKTTWGQLSSVTTNLNQSQWYELSQVQIKIGRNPDNTISIPDARLSGCHCTITFDEQSGLATIEDTSSNGTFINDTQLGKGNQKVVKNGDQIFILHKSKVAEKDQIGFIFLQQVFVDPKIEQEKMKIISEKEDLLKKLKDIQDDNKKVKPKADEDYSEEIQCSICLEIIFQCITLSPCMHNFCGSCFSDWMKKSWECPKCRKMADSACKNSTINNIIERYLQNHPEKQQSDEQLEIKKKNNIINSDIVRTVKKDQPKPAPMVMPVIPDKPSIRSRGRQPKDDSDSDASPKIPQKGQCRQCVNQRALDKFSCLPVTRHVNCTACKNLFPDRALTQYPQSCEICTNYFCNLYFQDCNGMQGGLKNGLFILREYEYPNKIDQYVFRGNQVEAENLSDYLESQKLTTKDVYQYMLKNYLDQKNFTYRITQGLMPTKNQMNIQLSSDSALCYVCLPQFWFQILFVYYNDIKQEFPKAVSDRGDCWWGINCKTMINDVHARKLNHIILQTQF